MSKTSISRILNDNAVDALPFSPLVWTTKGFQILTNDVYNLKKIQTSLYKVHADLTENLRDIREIKNEVDRADESVVRLVDQQKLLIVIAGELQNKVFPALQTLSRLGTRISITNAEVQRSLVTAYDIHSIVDIIRKGQLLQAIGKDVETIVDDSKYLLTTKRATGILESGDGIADVNYHPNSNTYEISSGVAGNADRISTGLGIVSKVAADRKSTKISITRDFLDLATDSGLILGFTAANSVFSLRPTTSLVRVAPNSGLSISQNSSGSFVIDIAPNLQAATTRKYNAGHGVTLTGKTIAVDTSVFQKFNSGSPGVSINKVSINPDTYAIDFDETLEGIPETLFKKLQVDVRAPLTLNYSVATNSYKIGLDKTSVLINSSISGALDGDVDDLESDAKNLIVKRVVEKENLGPSFRKIYTNPLIRMFNLLIGDYEKSEIAGNQTYSGVNSVQTLQQRFGIKPTLIDVHDNIIPYIYTSGHFSNNTLGTDIDVDLFAMLEAKLQRELKDPYFTIKDSDKNTLFSLVEVSTSTISALNFVEFENKKTSIIKYNSAFNLDFIEGFLSSKFIRDVIGTTLSCETLAPLSSYVSTKFLNFKLSVTAGDIDFIIGNNTNGQRNAVPLILPSALQEIDKIKLRSVTEVFDEVKMEIVYTMTIYDGYTATTYVSKFAKSIAGAVGLDMDYVNEIAGETNPGQVRAFARLYANGRLSDLDINRIIFFFGRSAKCYAFLFSIFIREGVLNQKLFNRDQTDDIVIPDYSIRSNPSKIDYVKGTIKIAAILASDYYKLTNDSTFNIVGQIKIRAQFRIEGLTKFLSPENLMSISCWDTTISSGSARQDCNSTGVRAENLPFKSPVPEDLFK